jgi:hypothetical protein
VVATARTASATIAATRDRALDQRRDGVIARP